MFVSSAQLAFDIAERRIAALTSESEAFDRRDALRSEQEACASIEEDWARQAQSEQQAESAWLRAAEYDPRMENPREW